MKYELMLMLKPLTNEDIRDKVLARIEKTLKVLNGSLKIKDAIGKRLLAYKIKNFREGYYVLCTVDLSSKKIQEFKKELKLTQDIIRFLLIQEEKL
jgi:small subunit ribosomal protein S6